MILSTRGVFRLALLVAFVGSFCNSAHAQTGACPTGTAVAVNPSGLVCAQVDVANYNSTTSVSGGPQVPTIVRLDLLLFGPTKTNTATDAPDQTIPIGKPTVNPQGAIWFNVPAIAALPAGQTWKARIVSVGQPTVTGAPAQVSARSPESNPFLQAAPATAPLAPLSVSVPAS